ncbi:Tripartite tricarboxylate transporter TctB family protein [Roseivivax sp. THAF40]|uniref:tripartite tricarboxylate transporter TctB family protein n=1 Tax=unclassified Roseivivax TaxID=2639302 RepID=UPI0012697528|nr:MULTISPECIES: tripartite tricarboxylate transporter TctB family protein [unclassified Roseivivax]QFS82595.1 Tripartite tricarboxylate transporter TctB family protein [Roseivivax sp. THAF197b]QFT46364.1 Tripartite tricarboxylate transporter TctB family protein [Roseivivax sp. THAF40]
MRRGEISLAGLFALFSIYLMWKATELPVGYIRGEGPGGGFWPFWLSAVMFLSCVAIAINWWRGKSPASQSDEPMMDDFGWRTVFLVGGGVVGFVALISVVSMYGAIALFLLYYLRILGRHSWWLTLIMAIGLPILLFFFFEGAMMISMPQGMAFTQPFFDVMYDIIY